LMCRRISWMVRTLDEPNDVMYTLYRVYIRGDFS